MPLLMIIIALVITAGGVAVEVQRAQAFHEHAVKAAPCIPVEGPRKGTTPVVPVQCGHEESPVQP